MVASIRRLFITDERHFVMYLCDRVKQTRFIVTVAKPR